MREIHQFISDDIDRQARNYSLMPARADVEHYISKDYKKPAPVKATEEFRSFDRSCSILEHLINNTLSRKDMVGLTEEQLKLLADPAVITNYEDFIIFMFEHSLHFVHRKKGIINYSFIVSEKVHRELMF